MRHRFLQKLVRFGDFLVLPSVGMISARCWLQHDTYFPESTMHDAFNLLCVTTMYPGARELSIVLSMRTTQHAEISISE